MEKDCNCNEHVHEHDHDHNHENEEKSIFEKILTIIGIVLFIIAVILDIGFKYEMFSFILYVISYILIGYEIILNAILNIFHKEIFDENFLMVLATIGAFFTHQNLEAVSVLILYKIGEFLQDKAVENSRKKISAAVDLRTNKAWIKKGQSVLECDANSLKIGDEIIVKTGEKVPVDAILLNEQAIFDMSALNGESKEVLVCQNKEVLSGSVNKGSVISLKVSKTFENSTVSQIMKLIENSVTKKSNTEKFITKFARIYTPVVTLIALIIALLPLVTDIGFEQSIFRACTFLVISCPCALVISVPLGFFVGIGASSKNGILVKGSNYLDILSNVNTVIFDKTGTLTKGVFEIQKNVSLGNLSQDEVLEKIAYCENFSNHYIARSILKKYDKQIDSSKVVYHEEIPGLGIKAKINDEEILVGSNALLRKFDIKIKEKNEEGTLVYLAINNKLEGYIVLSDTIKEGAKDINEKLRMLGIKRVLMLTGDKKEASFEVSKKLGIDEIFTELLPKDKVDKIESIKRENINNKIAFVGDGINDAPVLAMADVGIAMGEGSDLAIESADVVLLNDNLVKIIDAIKISKKTKRVVKQNIIFAIVVKILFLVLSGFGITSMWFAIFADVGVALITILNSIRIFKFKS